MMSHPNNAENPFVVQCDAIVVGTGISGLFTAIKLSEQGVKTVLLTKATLDESNSRYAQGGIAAVLPGNPSDSLELHVRDTLLAGAGLCDEKAVRSILSEGWDAIEDLLIHGVPFDRVSDGEQGLALGREAAHSVPRILHAGGDATGHCVEMALIHATKAHPLITVIEHAPVTRLLYEANAEGTRSCFGCLAVELPSQRQLRIESRFTVLATGGVGRLYSHTTNPTVATGDGIALAHNAGAEIQDMEFIQFHPTAFYADGHVRFLVSEALRGEGGLLRNVAGELFASKYHPDAELAPRDVVTRAIYEEMRQSDSQHVWLDMTALPARLLEARFPTIRERALFFGVDICTDWIPVAPAAHYLMGGIATDDYGQSSVKNLYAVGEVARTGLHGANRLASNSLLECVVLARRVAERIGDQVAVETIEQSTISWHNQEPVANSNETLKITVDQDFEGIQAELCQTMWNQVGILRHSKPLQDALERIDDWLKQGHQENWASHIPNGLTLMNQLTVSRLITKASLLRTESCGAHMRTDQPQAKSVLSSNV